MFFAMPLGQSGSLGPVHCVLVPQVLVARDRIGGMIPWQGGGGQDHAHAGSALIAEDAKGSVFLLTQ